MGSFYTESSYPLDEKWAAEAFESLLASPTLGCAFLALDGERDAGYVVLTLRYTMEHGGLSTYIDDLFVRSEYRRRHVASALLDSLIAECKARGCKSMHVEVGEANEPALELYKRYGLQQATDGRILLSCSL